MKKLCIYFFLVLFSLQTPSWAEDIRDFQIEHISLGDSLLDHFTEEEIVSLKNSYKDKGYIYNSKKFYSITFRNHPNLQTYEHLQFILKDKDKSYKIYAVLGVIDFRTNITQCYKDLEVIENQLDKVFVNADKSQRERVQTQADKTGKSTIESIAYFINSDVVVASCADWSEIMDISDALRVTIRSKTYNTFLANEPYK